MQIEFLSAIEEGHYVIAQANAGARQARQAHRRRWCPAAIKNEFELKAPEDVQYMDVAPLADRVGGGVADSVPRAR
jgi:DNA-directed RNA polymerase subunit beta